MRLIFTFFIVCYFAPFFLAFPCGLLCNIISCAAKMCICVADSYIFGILSEIAQPTSRLRSTNFPVWDLCGCVDVIMTMITYLVDLQGVQVPIWKLVVWFSKVNTDIKNLGKLSIDNPPSHLRKSFF